MDLVASQEVSVLGAAFDSVIRLDGAEAGSPVVVEDVSDSGICVSVDADGTFDLPPLKQAELVFHTRDELSERLLKIPAEFVRVADRDAARLHLAFRFQSSSPEVVAELRALRR